MHRQGGRGVNIILLGPPGAGKGTQAGRLVSEHGMVEPSPCDTLRAAVAQGTIAGLRAKALMEAGQLVPDALVSGIICDRLDSLHTDQRVIFDGYPRTHAQAASLDQILAERRRRLAHVIELVVDEDALVSRIVGRFSCASCGAGYHESFKAPMVEGHCDICGGQEFTRRADDNEEAVRTRMVEYRAKTAPILPYYEARGLVSRIDGMADIAEVGNAVDAILASGV